MRISACTLIVSAHIVVEVPADFLGLAWLAVSPDWSALGLSARPSFWLNDGDILWDS